MALQLNYLAAAEYTKFGLPSTTTDDLVSEASNVIDAYLQRAEGLLWTPDANGAPLCMTRKAPDSARVLAGAIAPGLLVPATLTDGAIIQLGDVLVLNRGALNAHVAEAVKVDSVVDNTHVILTSVAGLHSIGETAETGLTITETVLLPKNRNVASVTKGPIAKLCASYGRISYGRRGDSTAQMQDYALFQASSAFGGAPLWQFMDVKQSDIDINTNQIWCPVGILMIPYSEVKFSYIAGFQASALPYQVKQATANVVGAIVEAPASANVKSFKAGETQMLRFIDSIIDGDTRSLLAAYTARNYI